MSRFAPLSLLLALALTGCTGTTAGSGSEAGTEAVAEASSEASSEEVPELGACRVLAPEDLPEPVNTDPKVPCSGPHTAETFAVGQLPGSLDDASYDDERLGEFAFDTCTRAFMRFTGANESLALRSLLSWAWFRPTADAWAEGARWYRCDVVGGDEDSAELLELPRTARGLLLGTGDDRVMQCVRGEAVPGAPRVPCSEPHDWRAVTTIVLGTEDDPYPGDRLVEVRSRDFCDDSVSAWLDYPLQYVFAYTWLHEAEWEAGNRRSICWARYDR